MTHHADRAQQRESQIIRLGDGRKLSYAEYGDPGGAPVLYFHGTPGSRLEGRLLDGAAAHRGVRLIAADRPGMGLSSYEQGRTIVEWPADAANLADALGVTRYAVCGFSNGAVYALACGTVTPARVNTIALIGAPEPRAVGGGIRLGLMRRTSSPFAWLMKQLSRLPATLIPPIDPSLRDEDMRRAYRQIAQEAFRRGSRGVAHELTMFTRSWGFSPADVRRQVQLWHAEDDRLAPIEGARRLAEQLPHAEATYVPEGGHYLHRTQGDAILRDLVSTDVSRGVAASG